MRFQSQLNKLSVLCVVVMFLFFYPRIGHGYGLHVKPKLFPCSRNKGGKFVDRKLLRELIEDPKLTSLCRSCNGKFNTLNCISYVKVSSGLPSKKSAKYWSRNELHARQWEASMEGHDESSIIEFKRSYLAPFSIYSERMFNSSLNTKPIKCSSKHTIIIKPVAELLMHFSLICPRPINDSLVQIGCSYPPSLASKCDVVRIMDLAQMIEGACLLGIRQSICSSIVSNSYATLLNVNVWSSIFSHCAKFHQMTLLSELLYSKENIESSDYIIMLSEHSPRSINHGVWGRPLFPKMNNCIRLKWLEAFW